MVRNAQMMWVMSVLLAAPALGAEVVLSGPREELPATHVAPTPCCGAAIVPGGHFEAEANYSGDGVRGSFVHTSNLTLKYSFTDRVQLQVGTNNFLLGGGGFSARAFDGVSAGVKVVLLEQGELAPQVSVSAHAVFPTLTIDDALQTTFDTYAMAYASKDFGPIHLDVTATVLVADLAGVPFLQGAAALTATWNVTEQWGFATGPYSSFGNPDRGGVDGGWFGAVNWSPFPELAFTAGVEAGFFQETRSYSVFGGVAWVPTAYAKIPLAARPAAVGPQLASR
jgi:hypothetical protein